MKPVLRSISVLGAASLTAFLAACGRDAVQPSAMVPATLTLHRSVQAAALASLVMDNDSTPGRPAPVPAALVDSLTVTITGVRVHLRRAMHDSLEGPDSLDDDSIRPMGDGGDGDRGRQGGMGGRDGDDDGNRPMEGDSGQGEFTLNVTSGAHIDLIHLPAENEPGLVVASGSLPPGTYDRARLQVTDGVIWLNTPVVTPQGDTLPANTPIPVVFPSGSIHLDVEFTVPEGGGDVPVIFDEDESLAHILITGNGTVIMTPVLRCGRGRD
jgi:hypothetical protein